MKKVFLCIILIMISFCCIKVYAEEPKTAGDYKYLVEKYALRVYQINMDGDGEMDMESLIKYQTHNYDKEIDIPLSDISYTMDSATTEKKTMGNGMNIQIINLNANITSAKVNALLADEKNAVSSSNYYIVELVVYYKITDAPSEYTKFYTVNMYKSYVKLLFETFTTFNYGFADGYAETHLNESNSQVINLITITPDGLDYATTAADTSPPLVIFNYFQFAKNGETFSFDEEPQHILFFANVSDTDYLVSMISELFEGDDIDDLDIPGANPSTVIKVGDAALNRSKTQIMIGMIIVLLGLAMIGKVFLTRHEKEN